MTTPAETALKKKLREVQREKLNLKKHLTELVRASQQIIKLIDAEMKKPPSLERGKKMGALTTALEMQVDSARHFGLGEKL